VKADNRKGDARERVSNRSRGGFLSYQKRRGAGKDEKAKRRAKHDEYDNKKKRRKKGMGKKKKMGVPWME